MRGWDQFELKRTGRHESKVIWKGRIRMPLLLGGRATGFFGGLIFHLLARRDLRNLRELLSD